MMTSKRRWVFTAEQMRTADQFLIETRGVPSIVLMENAARSAAEIIRTIVQQHFSTAPPVGVLCGPGNNGGDGFALARHLSSDFSVSVWWIGQRERMSPETRTNLEVLERLHLPVQHLTEETADLSMLISPSAILIDALLGVGGSEHPRGLVAKILDQLAQLPAPALTIAIDVPTGLNATTGKAYERTIRADYTITMAAIKTGLILNDGIECSGQIAIASLGVPLSALEALPHRWVLDPVEVGAFLKKRRRRTTKRDYGTVVVIGGHRDMPGAAALAANAAIAAGAGLVRLMAPTIHPQVRPEVITMPLVADASGSIAPQNQERLFQMLETADSVVIGPGVGRSEETITLMRMVLMQAMKSNIPTVVDADGLRAIRPEDRLTGTCILTPHLGEFCRMTRCEYATVRDKGLWLAEEWAQRWNGIVVLKDVPTIVTTGTQTALHTGGTPAMATAGSGDVLSGILGGLLAQHYDPFEAAQIAVAVHGIAGQRFEQHFAPEPLTASRLLEFLPEAFRQLRRGQS